MALLGPPPPHASSKSRSTIQRIHLLPLTKPFADETNAPPAGAAEDDEVEEPEKVSSLPVVEDLSVPFGHVVLRGAQNATGPKVEEWDIVRGWLDDEAKASSVQADPDTDGHQDGSREKTREEYMERDRLRSVDFPPLEAKPLLTHI